MQPGPAPLTKPTPPEFKLRKLTKGAYGMSVTTGGIGQVLFLGFAFGGGWWYVAAFFIAAFAEFVMAASGDSSLEHRVQERAWKLMLGLSLTVAAYAGANQLLHFWHKNIALAITFAGASVAGFLLHILDGHIRAAAYLRDLKRWRVANTAVPQPRPARQAPPRTANKITAKASEAPAMTVEPAENTAPTAANVRPIGSAKGISQREQVWQWFVEQVDATGGDVNAVTGPDLVKQFGSEHLKKKISDLRKRYENERSNTAVNE